MTCALAFESVIFRVMSRRRQFTRRNADVLPKVKINADAMARMSQLAQEGFVEIPEWD